MPPESPNQETLKRRALVANWRKNNPERYALHQERSRAKVKATRALPLGDDQKIRAAKERALKTMGSIFRRARDKSKQKELSWSISREQFESLRSQPCVYCQYPLPPMGIGLDRLDNSRGYEPSNVVPCCTVCNTARNNNFTHTEMLNEIGPVIRRVRLAREIPPYAPSDL